MMSKLQSELAHKESAMESKVNKRDVVVQTEKYYQYDQVICKLVSHHNYCS